MAYFLLLIPQCDAFRPCSMCVKARVVCVNRSVNETRSDDDGRDVRPMQSPKSPLRERAAKIRRVSRYRQPDPDLPTRWGSPAGGSLRRPSHSATPDPELGGGDGGDERAEGATKIIDIKASNMNTNLFTLTPGHLMENPSVGEAEGTDASPDAMLGSGLVSDLRVEPSPSAISTIIDPQYPAVLPWSYCRASTASLLAQLPIRPVADYLVAVYFNTVHWFMVLLHEGHFLHHYRAMMDLYARDPKMLAKNTDEDYTFALLILTMVVLGGRYTSIHSARAKRCREIHNQFYSTAHGSRGADPGDYDIVEATSRLFSVVRSNTTDNLACRTLATVQSLLLLGSVCLYHCESNLAWAYSGSTIRTAQALGLHKDGSEQRWTSPYYRNITLPERCQQRRRLVWAVHTSDRFLAMCYGLPLVISDGDCLADAPCEDTVYPLSGCSSFLMIEDDLVGDPQSLGGGEAVTLLTYHTYKLHIYIILDDIISSLYRPSSGAVNPLLSKFGPVPTAPNGHDGSPPSKTKYLIEMAQRLEAKLHSWYADLPEALRLHPSDMSYPAYDEFLLGDRDYNQDEDDEIIIPAYDDPLLHSSEATRWRRRRIRTAIYGLQALLLQLAYDNALILINRPILACTGTAGSDLAVVSRETFDRSVNVCWQAALRISRIGNHHIFQRGQQTHAISYVGIHLFTAGVVLGVFANSDPLGRRGLAAKQALRRVIAMQRRLRRKVVVSGQGLAILENLAREVVRKEVAAILAQDTDREDKDGRWGIAQVEGKNESNWNSIVDLTGESHAQEGPDLAGSVRQGAFSISGPDVPPELAAGFHGSFVPERDMFNESILDIEKSTSKYVIHFMRVNN